MNALVQDTSPNGTAQEPLDKPAGEAAPARKEYRGPLDGIEEGMRADQLESLGWLRRYGMGIAERLDRYSRGLLLSQELQGPFQDVDVALAFSRIAKAVRQIIVLEQETAGVREMRVPRDVAERAAEREAAKPKPDYSAIIASLERDEESEPDDRRDRDDTQDYDDYRSGPVDAIIADLRAELDAMPGAAHVACAMAATSASIEAIAPEPAAKPDDPNDRLPGETGEQWRQRLIAERIRALEAKYGTGPP